MILPKMRKEALDKAASAGDPRGFLFSVTGWGVAHLVGCVAVLVGGWEA